MKDAKNPLISKKVTLSPAKLVTV